MNGENSCACHFHYCIEGGHRHVEHNNKYLLLHNNVPFCAALQSV